MNEFMEKVLKLDGVEVVYYHATGEYEVWAMFANGADDFDWDVVATVDNNDEAVKIARKVSHQMDMADLLT